MDRLDIDHSGGTVLHLHRSQRAEVQRAVLCDCGSGGDHSDILRCDPARKGLQGEGMVRT